MIRFALPVLLMFLLSACEEGGFRGLGAGSSAPGESSGPGGGGGGADPGGDGGSGQSCDVDSASGTYATKISGSVNYSKGGLSPTVANFSFKYNLSGSNVTGPYKDCVFFSSPKSTTMSINDSVLRLPLDSPVDGARRVLFTIQQDDGTNLAGLFETFNAASGGSLVHSGTFTATRSGAAPPSGGGPEITGVWRTCITQGAQSGRVTITPGDPMVYEELIYGGPNCTGTQLYRSVYRYEVEFNGTSTVEGVAAYNIDMKAKVADLTPLTKDVAKALNEDEFCGMTGWAKDAKRLVNSCHDPDESLDFPGYGEMFYSVLYVNGNDMKIGVATEARPGSTDYSRHDTFLNAIFVKQ